MVICVGVTIGLTFLVDLIVNVEVIGNNNGWPALGHCHNVGRCHDGQVEQVFKLTSSPHILLDIISHIPCGR
jgi:hypothetical protein